MLSKQRTADLSVEIAQTSFIPIIPDLPDLPDQPKKIYRV